MGNESEESAKLVLYNNPAYKFRASTSFDGNFISLIAQVKSFDTGIDIPLISFQGETLEVVEETTVTIDANEEEIQSKKASSISQWKTKIKLPFPMKIEAKEVTEDLVTFILLGKSQKQEWF